MTKIIKSLICMVLMAAALFGQTVGATPKDDFFSAVTNDSESTLLTLMLRGFDVNTLDERGRSGLYIAAAEGSFKVAKVLLDWNLTNVNALTPQNESPLMMAALKGHVALAKRIIERGGDVNKTGWAPLHYAATGGNIEMIKLLLEESAYIDAESPNRSTPLMMAAMYGTAEAAKLLMEEGADPTLKNEKGLTAIDFAQMAKRDDVAQAIGKTIRMKQPGAAPLAAPAPAAKPAPVPKSESMATPVTSIPFHLKPETQINFNFESTKVPEKVGN